MPKRLAIFDCDGTLVDSQHGICAAMNHAFAVAGLPQPERQAILSVVGLSALHAVARLAPEVDAQVHDRLCDDYKAHFRDQRTSGVLAEPLYDGIADLLDRLEGDGWLLGVATGKSDRGLELCLRGHGIRDRFVTLQTADRHPSKPHPSMLLEAMEEAGAEPHTTVMIGDTSFDIEMAVAAGVPGLGVAWGYHRPDYLIGAGAVSVAMDSAQLHAHIAAHA